MNKNQDMDRRDEMDLLIDTAEHMKTRAFVKESAFKDYIQALKKHKTAIMDTEFVPKEVESLKAELDGVILSWIEKQNPKMTSLVSAQPEADTDETSESASGLRKSYGALVNMNLENDLEMARTKAKVVVQEIKREIILASLEEISAKYGEI